MRLLLILPLFLLLTVAVPAQPPDTLWTQTCGGASLDWGYSIAQTADGGYILAGDTRSFGAGEDDVYLVKIDENGNEVWFRTFGGKLQDFARCVQQTSDGGFIIVGRSCSFGTANSSDIYLIKTDNAGNESWHQTFGGYGTDYGHSVRQTNEGGYIVVGQENDLPSAVYLIKTDIDGNEQWSRTYAGYDEAIGFDVQQTSDLGYIVVGETIFLNQRDLYLLKTDASGNEIWSHTYSSSDQTQGKSVVQTADGGYIIAGTTAYLIGQTDEQVYLLKTDIHGNEIWSRTYGQSGSDEGNCVRPTLDGGYIIAGKTLSVADFYLIKTAANGNETWSQTFGGTGVDIGHSVQQTTDGGYIIAGYTVSFGWNAYVVRLASDGFPAITVTLIPFTFPVQIPAAGGSFEFYAFLQNNEPVPATTDLWIDASLPGGTVTDPLIGPAEFLLEPGTTGWYRIQNVPAHAPAGTYQYTGHIGTYPNLVWAEDHIQFEKLPGSGDVDVFDWSSSGKPAYQTALPARIQTPADLAVALHPNPFNPTTTISFDLPVARQVNLQVFDTQGRFVTSHQSPATSHYAFPFDGSNLPSGIYFYRLTAGDYTGTGKMVLMK